MASRGPIRARRGPVCVIRPGTNIVWAGIELTKALDELDHSAIQRSLQCWLDYPLWKLNPPASSHIGGVWERQIRSVRSALSTLIHERGHTLDDEYFRTLVTEVKWIINSRPLTVPLSDPEDLDPLTPDHIPTMKARVDMLSLGNLQKADLYLRQRWKRVQNISNVFRLDGEKSRTKIYNKQCNRTALEKISKRETWYRS